MAYRYRLRPSRSASPERRRDSEDEELAPPQATPRRGNPPQPQPQPQPNLAAGVNQEDRLATILEAMLQMQRNQEPARRAPREFKLPEFDGTGNVDYYVRQVQDIIIANEWTDEAALLHLRHSLKGIAQECGRPETLGGVMRALTIRFGMSASEARIKLAKLKRDSRKSLHSHAAQVEELVEAAHPGLPMESRRQMALDLFQTSLDNDYLQGQLLTIQPRTMEEAVTRGNEFLRLNINLGHRPHVRQLEEEDDREPTEVVAQPVQAPSGVPDWVRDLQREVSRLSRELADLRQDGAPSRSRSRPPPPTSLVRCWGCGGGGHLRRSCPSEPQPRSGNEVSPRQ